MTDNLLSAVRQWVSIQQSEFTTRDVSAFLIQRFPDLVHSYLRKRATSCLNDLARREGAVVRLAHVPNGVSVWRRIEK